jgi:V8-like Glu-specific endopeptidase
MKKKNMTVWCTVLSMLFIVVGSQGVFAEELIGETAPIDLSTAHPYAAGSPGETVRSFEVSRHDATFIIVHFTNFSLYDGDHVEIRDRKGILRQVITNEDPGKTDFWALVVDGDTASVNLISGSAGAQAYGFDIDQYGYGIIPLGIESICGTDDKVDIECVNGTTQYERAKSVGRMLYQKVSLWYLCTGSLVSGENHFLSNEHCVNSQAIVDTLQVRFNYQYTTCGGSTVATYDTYYGDTFLVFNYNYDTSLMTLSGNPQATYGHLELDPRDMILNETVYIPQHPGGVPKKYDYGPVVDPVANGRTTGSDFGYRVDTAGGSSGSPVLSMTDHTVVGLHHFGGCEDPPDFQNQGVLMKNVYPIIEPYLSVSNPKARQPRPVPMGVSISTTPSLPFIFAGTAGMRVRSLTDPNIKFILSNNHVIGAVGPTLCPDTAPLRTWVLQPGTLDIDMDPGNDPFYVVGLKFRSVPIDFAPGASNLVDAAIAFTTTSFAGNTILDLGGPPSPDWPAIALPGMVVTKSGRTTGVTEGTVQAINVTAFVSYDTCGTARFVNQVTVTPGSFSASGDSGSVVLEKSTMKPVGLLFAGGSTNAIMNHIFFVYKSLGVFVD